MKHPLVTRSLLLPLMLAAGGAMAARDNVPETTGFSGNVLFAAGYLDLENSYVAGNRLIDVKNNTISGYGSPSGESDVYPFLTGEVDYTFANRRQVFFGNDLEDLVTLDAVQKLGVRQQWDSVGVMGVSLLLSGIPGEVWEDPYLLNTPRNDTDRDSTGLQFDWYRILDSNFYSSVSFRDIDIDNEQSGVQFCNGDIACTNALRRDGDDTRLTFGYRARQGSSIWVPELTIGEDDRDGNAVSRDVMGLKLSYSYLGEVWTPVASVAYLDYEYDQLNPVFNQRTDADGFAVSASLFRKLEWGDGNWSLVGSVVGADIDSRVNFNDTSALSINFGANYTFGK
jgi:Protein of unknown function (DUF2860)